MPCGESWRIYLTGFPHDGLAFISDDHAETLNNVKVLPDDALLNITGDSGARVCQIDTAVLPARGNQSAGCIPLALQNVREGLDDELGLDFCAQ